MYFSTFLTDFLFIKENDLDIAIHVLRTSFPVTIDMVQGEEQVPYVGNGDAGIWQAQLDRVAQESFIDTDGAESADSGIKSDVYRCLSPFLFYPLCDHPPPLMNSTHRYAQAPPLHRTFKALHLQTRKEHGAHALARAGAAAALPPHQ
jgi:hypothetical protein